MRPVCGFHYESGGKCNLISSPDSVEWPQIGKVCEEHERLLKQEEIIARRRPNLGEVMEDIITPLREDPEAGDWVVVFAQVKRISLGGEQVEVNLFSKTDQYTGAVRRDLVKKIQPPRGIAERCTHLGEFQEVGSQEYLLKRCTQHLHHDGLHTARNRGQQEQWTNNESVGYMEDR